MIQGSQITALLKMAGERSDRPGRAMTPTPQSLGAAATGTLLTPDNLYRFREIISFTHMQTLLTLFSFFFYSFRTLTSDDTSLERCSNTFTVPHTCTHKHIGAKLHIAPFDLPWVESGWAARGTGKTGQVHYLTMKG